MSAHPQELRGHLSRQQPSLALWRAPAYHMGHKDARPMSSASPSRKGQLAFTSVLLLARHEDHAVVDRQSLRRVGIRAVRMLTSGAEAARILSGMQRLTDNAPFPDLALCDEQLSDMTGLEFLALMRSHPRLASFPVIMALMRDTPSVRRECEELACSGLLFRPYSEDAFLNQMARASAMHPPKTGPADWEAGEGEDIGAFERAMSRFALSRRVSDQSAGQWFREGLLCLKHEQWENAAIAFRQALKDQAGHEDAIKGLTLALRKRQEEAEGNPHLRRRRLSKEEADALRENLVRAAASGNPEEAIHQAMIAALGEDFPLGYGSFSPEWGEQEPVSPAAEHRSSSSDASAKLSGAGAGPKSETRSSAPMVLKPLPELREPDGSGVLSRFPLLRDAVNVARVTLGLYKSNKK